MRKNLLLAGVAVAALMIGASGAMAQTAVTQTTDNYSPVNNQTTSTIVPGITTGGLTGAGASAAIGATGAASSVSVVGNAATLQPGNQALTLPASGFGTITQATTNHAGGTVQNGVAGSAGTTIDLGGFATGAGSSASVSATGALSAVSVTGIDTTPNTNTFAPPAFTSTVTQTSANNDTVTNTLGTVSNGAGLGIGASASVSATGSAASFSESFNNGLAVSASTVTGLVTQGSRNVSGATVHNDSGTISVGGAMAQGSAASVSATGSLASVGFSDISSTTVSSFALTGGVDQGKTNAVANGANVTNDGTPNPSITVGGGIGQGASASVSATGVAAAVSISGNGSGTFTVANIGPIDQGSLGNPVYNAGVITNTNGQILNVGVVGDGGSASVSATGAEASVSVTMDHVGAVTGGYISTTTINQYVANNVALTGVRNTGASITSTGAAVGDGGSLSIGSTGAIAAIGLLQNNSGQGTFTIGGTGITQFSENTSLVTNSGTIMGAAVLSGAGSSASISGTGAAASVSIASIDPGLTSLATPTIGSIGQTALNHTNSTVTNNGTITLGGMSGVGASASISATGAGAFVNLSAIR